MDYKVEWCEFVSPFDWAEAVKSVEFETSTLRVGEGRYFDLKDVKRYIDVRNKDGDYLQWCVRVLFPKKTTDEKQDEVMQTVLMMAKARYGL